MFTSTLLSRNGSNDLDNILYLDKVLLYKFFYKGLFPDIRYFTHKKPERSTVTQEIIEQ